MPKIRTLTGAKAIEYQKQVEAGYVRVRIPLVLYPLLEVRAVLVKILTGRNKYFSVRHKYSTEDRRLLDILFIGEYEDKLKDDNFRPRYMDTFRYKRLRHLYRKEFDDKPEWIRVTPHSAKPKFVWHEDINEYESAGPS